MRDEKKLRYTSEHEWLDIEADNTLAVVGISDHAQNSLGDIVYVELPKLGSQVKKDEIIASVESVKTTSDIYAPVSGEIVAVNEALSSTPENINTAPYETWIFKIQLSNEEELKTLLSFEDYLTHT